jgi:hypothetical protein
MSENRKPRKKAGAIVALVLLLLLLPLPYVASIGPAIALTADGELSPSTYVSLYAPVHRAANSSGPTRRALLG